MDDVGEAIAVDSMGDAYLAGWTYSDDFPVTSGAFQRVNHAPLLTANAFVAKFDSSQQGAASLIYSTYLGDTSNSGYEDIASGIAVDAAGDVYLTGQTASIDNRSCLGNDSQNGCCSLERHHGNCIPFPTTPDAFQTVNRAAAGGALNAFVTELNADGSTLIYSTYMGGNLQDYGTAIAIDSAGNAYMTGVARSISNYSCTARFLPYWCCKGRKVGVCERFPVTRRAFQRQSGVGAGGGDNAFFAKLNIGRVNPHR